MDIGEVAERLAQRAEEVCRYLLPGGKAQGREWVDDPGSGKIKVVLRGDKAGKWSHFGGDGGGDLVDLFAKAKGLTPKEAYREAKAFLGIDTPSLATPRKREFNRPTPPEETRAAVRGTAVEQYLRGERGLTPETIKAFRIREASVYRYTHRETGEERTWPGPWVLFPYLRGGDLINIKWLHTERVADPETGKKKKRTLMARGTEYCLFGWHLIPPDARSIVIFEGEIDAMTGHQIGLPSLSVPAGAGRGDKQQWIENDWDDLERFEEIILCMDADDEGMGCIHEIAHRLGKHRCRYVILPHKDLNECVAGQGMTADELTSYFRNRGLPEAQGTPQTQRIRGGVDR